MFSRRALLCITTLASLTIGCRLFKPISPIEPPRPKEARAKPAEPQPAPVAEAPAPVPIQPAPTPVMTPMPTPSRVPSNPAPMQPAPKPSKSPPTAAQVGNVTDPNIAAMVLASNNTDISYARLVPSRAGRTDVKEFAARMLTDHAAVNTLVVDLLNKLDLGAEDNALSLDMRDESADRRDAMRDLSGYAFDSTYITNEVKYHQKFLASLDNVMLPRAKNVQLRNLLTIVRPAVAAHLAHAEQVWANVMSKR